MDDIIARIEALEARLPPAGEVEAAEAELHAAKAKAQIWQAIGQDALRQNTALEGQIVTLRQRLAEECDKRQAAEAKLVEVQDMLKHYKHIANAFDEPSEIIAHFAEEFATILDGDA